MDTECPYCASKSLEPINGPTEVYFDSLLKRDELNETNWRAFECSTCLNVCILDEDAVPTEDR